MRKCETLRLFLTMSDLKGLVLYVSFLLNVAGCKEHVVNILHIEPSENTITTMLVIF